MKSKKKSNRDDDVLSDILSLVGIEVSPSVINNWDDEQYIIAEKWGIILFRASDNNVRLPNMPDFLKEYKEGY